MTARTRVLFVDDDERLLQAAQRVLRKELDLDVACGGPQALQKLSETGPYAVLVSDQTMPGMSGATFLSKAADAWPHTVRIMLTGNADQGTASAAVNDGGVFRFLTKPCEPSVLLAAIQDAARHHALLEAEKDLLERTLSGGVKLLVDVLAAAQPRVFDTCNRVRRWARAAAPALPDVRAWELDVAAMLWPLGDITLPPELHAKIARGEPLSAVEADVAAQAPAAGHDLLVNIPRLESIAEAVYYSRARYDGGGFPDDGRKGEALPPLARALHVLIDLAEASDAPEEGFAILHATPERYDPECLTRIEQALAAASEVSASAATRAVVEVPSVTALREGDIAARDIVSTDGCLLLASGLEITAPIIHKLRQLARLGAATAPFRVLRTSGRAAA